MSLDTYEILPGALLISDAHYSRRRPQLLSLLKAVESGELGTLQLILMGDIFDLLFGQIAVTHKMNADVVAVLRRISRQIPVLYLEGNHDYNLQKLFPDARIVPLADQPLLCRCGDSNVLVAHGDFNQPLGYRVYTAWIRNPLVLNMLGLLNRITGNAIIDRLERYLDRKNDCYVIPGFETMMQKHLEGLDLVQIDAFIEGHYHQGRAFKVRGTSYFNPSAFACNQHYAIVRYEQKSMTLQERAWSGGV